LIRVRCLESLDEAAPLRDAADALNRASPRPDPFSTFAHYEALCRLLPSPGTDPRLWLLLAFRGDTLVGHLALRRDTQRLFGVPVDTLGLLAASDGDRPPVVARAEDLAEVSAAIWQHLLGRAGEWSLLVLHQQDRDSALWPAPPGVDLGGHRVREWPTLENCTVTVKWPTLGDYVASLARKFRANLRRQLHLLLAAGSVELLASADAAAAPALLALYQAVERRSWKAQAGVPGAGDALLRAAEPMRLSILVLLLDGRPLAGLIVGAYARVLHALHIVHDESRGQLGAGSVMLMLGMREAIDGGALAFNLRSGFGYYKTRWGAEVRPTRSVQVYRRGSLPDWHRRLGDLRRRLGAALVPAPVFNPVRRASRGESLAPAPAADEMAAWTAWAAQARSVPGTSLAGEALRAVLPLRPEPSR